MTTEIAPYLSASRQLIIVKAADWNGPAAAMQWLERPDLQSDWSPVGGPFEVVIGKKGLAWGKGQMPVPRGIHELKKEGDLKAPAGLFGLGTAFGYEEAPPFAWPYIPLHENMAGVDDPASKYYNRIVDQNDIQDPDWKSAETMLRPDGLYGWGMVINYNTDNPVKGAGSQIFMHIWRGPGQGTEGCTAMPEERMLALLKWIDEAKRPLLWQR